MPTRSLEYRKYSLLPTECRGTWTVVICHDRKPQADATNADTYFEAVWRAKRVVDAAWDEAAPAPKRAIDRLNRALRRRLSDRLEDIFKEACLAGDLDTAEELLTAMGRMQDRRTGVGAERRTQEDLTLKARDTLKHTRDRLSGRVA